jgi:hypothetical protein
MRQQATEDQVTHAQQRAFHVAARLRSLLDDWEIAPGEPELRERILALAPLGGELDRAVAAVTDVDGLSEVRVPLDLLVAAIHEIQGNWEALENLYPTRLALRDLLTAAYVLERTIPGAEPAEAVSSNRM